MARQLIGTMGGFRFRGHDENIRERTEKILENEIAKRESQFLIMIHRRHYRRCRSIGKSVRVIKDKHY